MTRLNDDDDALARVVSSGVIDVDCFIIDDDPDDAHNVAREYIALH
ncbi:hypothetical protein LCGC14_2966790, partial [marine sediment metagenome]